MTPNDKLKEFIRKYQVEPNDKELVENFNAIKRFLRLGTYNDPSGVLLYSDMEALALEGFWKAVTKYDETRWNNAIGWCFYLVRQTILREIKNTYSSDKTFINSHMAKDLEMDEIIEGLSIEAGFTFELSLFYINDIRFFCEKLYFVSPKANKAFQLRLAFPYLSRDSISKILGFKRRNGLAKIVKIIRANAKLYLDPTLIDKNE